MKPEGFSLPLASASVAASSGVRGLRGVALPEIPVVVVWCVPSRAGAHGPSRRGDARRVEPVVVGARAVRSALRASVVRVGSTASRGGVVERGTRLGPRPGARPGSPSSSWARPRACWPIIGPSPRGSAAPRRRCSRPQRSPSRRPRSGWIARRNRGPPRKPTRPRSSRIPAGRRHDAAPSSSRSRRDASLDVRNVAYACCRHRSA